MDSPQCSDDEWKEKLTPEQYAILRKKATEAPFSGKYNEFHGSGKFICAGCGAELFDAETKFDSGTGWPSFTSPVDEGSVTENTDKSLGMTRIEVECSKCGGHLGHVFDDGPNPTGLRYCINSMALELKPDQ
ncbi:MAG: peptide-methionine (R)-S-oxide reductase MsrB [Acidimicrobiales bacterium]|nr:peptide-methionine (R)-S-oxide reductase MsrB [Acidimicrobiales bacterium]